MDERIGFKIKENQLKLILPKFVRKNYLEELNPLAEKIKYFKLFRKYRSHSKELKKESLYDIENLKAEEYMYSIFEAYYLLLTDYIESGVFLFSKKKTNKMQKGRINWNKTISKSNLIISGDSLIYSSPYYMNNNILYNHPLTILYGLHLLEIEKHVGIKMNLNNQYRKTIEDNKRTINIKSILDNFKSSMFSDRERKVFKILETINKNSRNLNKTASNRNLYYLENINSLWEHMLKNILEDQYNSFKEYFPKGIYKLNVEGNEDVKTGLRIIPDIIKEFKGKLYIIDAKNYLPHINNNIPGTSDINKQLLYRYFLSKEFNEDNKYKLKNIKNVFLLPSDLQGKTIEKIGIHKFSNVENSMGNIDLYQVDYNSVVNAYIGNKKEIGEVILEGIEGNNLWFKEW